MRTLLLLLMACPAPTPVPTEVETDTDTDADTDSDTDTDTDSDTDTDADADTAEEFPLPGYGTLTGDCAVLDDEWTSTSPFLFRNAVDFGTVAYDPALLSPGGQTIDETGNLGGSSVESEAIAFDVLYRCELASLLKTEGEIVYQDAGGKKTDFLAEVDGIRVGVSVVRGFHYPPTEPMPEGQAIEVLEGKLDDILLSNVNVAPVDAWDRAILQVIAYDSATADVMESAWSTLDAETKDETLVLITVTDGEDAALY